MKRLLNTLFVTTQGTYLARDGETVLVRNDAETKAQYPIHVLSSIVCFGQVSCSPPLMGLCGERGVTLAFFSEHGRFFGRVEGPISGNVLLRRAQYRRADDEAASAEIARAVVTAKIANCRVALLRAARERPDESESDALRAASHALATHLEALREPVPLERVRGIEGDAAHVYFSAFDHMILAQREAFAFRGRSRRPPLDPINALLSFYYALLTNDMVSALSGVGLDPAVGFLHRDRPGRPGLALDLMEELRPFIADRLALTLVNRQQVRAKGFRKTESGAVMMDDDTRKEVLVAYQKRKQEEIEHPFLGEKIAVGLIPHVQAMLLARHLRGELDGYPPFLWK